jgi:hypothetical protein
MFDPTKQPQLKFERTCFVLLKWHVDTVVHDQMHATSKR